jgi:PadR family transcriptional regulator, regulatory protein PadR
MQLRRTPQHESLLAALLACPTEWRYGYELSRGTGLKSGTLYPMLIRLADQGALETRWAEAEPGKPPRHLYRIRASKLAAIRAWMAAARHETRPLLPACEVG